MLSCEYGETLEQVDQWSCRCPIPESVLGQTGWGFEQTGLMEGVLTHGSGVQRWSLRSFPAQNILWFCEVSADVQPLHRYQCTVPLSGASHQLWQTTLGRVEHPGHKDTQSSTGRCMAELREPHGTQVLSLQMFALLYPYWRILALDFC